VPLYWRELASVNPVELVAHRQIWSLVFLLAVVQWQRGFGEVFATFRSKKSVGLNALGALLLTGNWLIYVWGVNRGQVIECSLGYFLVPLMNIAAGRFLLHEHLRRTQWVAILLAGVGVGWMIVQLGRPPWVALVIAGTWGGYSLFRKQSQLGTFTGLTVETLMFAPVALGFLIWQEALGKGAFGHVDLRTHFLILSSGIITAVPLLLFAYGARRVRFSTLGLLQYFSPSVQLALGVWLFHESLSRTRLLSFGVIWLGLAVYTADNLWAQRRAATA